MKDKQMKGNESSSEWMECLSEVYLYLWPTACNLSSMMVRGSKRLGTVQEVKCDAQRRKKNEQFQNPKARLCLVSERERERESHLHRPSTIYYQLLTNSNLRKKKKKRKKLMTEKVTEDQLSFKLSLSVSSTVTVHILRWTHVCGRFRTGRLTHSLHSSGW